MDIYGHLWIMKIHGPKTISSVEWNSNMSVFTPWSGEIFHLQGADLILLLFDPDRREFQMLPRLASVVAEPRRTRKKWPWDDHRVDFLASYFPSLGGLEPWNFLTVNHKYVVNIWKYIWLIYGILWLSHHIGNVIIPTDELHHFSER